jgi:hypothetical protein
MFESNWKTELLKAALIMGMVAYEWWAMQPYHKPVMANLWLWMAKVCYWAARRLGAIGIAAESEYYEVVGP